MLLAVVGQPEGPLPQILSQVGVAPQAFVNELTRDVAAKSRLGTPQSSIGLSRATMDVLGEAEHQGPEMRLLQGESHAGDDLHVDRGRAGLEFTAGTAGWPPSPHA